jgi:pseudaminic acid synthase
MALMLNGKPLDDPAHIFIVAELSGNHGQDYAQAEALVRAAAEAGADAVKTQTFVPAEIAADCPFPYGHDAATDVWARGLGVERFPDLFRHGGLPRPWHAPLKALAESLGLVFLSTPFSVDAARFLVEEIGVSALKIASGDLTFTPLLAYADRTGLPIILSTGAATLAEIDTAVRSDLIETWLARRLVVLHCRSIYPCHPTVMNLLSLRTLATRYACPVGLSDHTLDTERIPSMAVTLGASCYEKHLRLADDTTSIDVQHSLTPTQFAHMVDVLRATPVILGDGVKEPHVLEQHDRLFARRDPCDGLRPMMAARQGAWA